MSDWQGREVCSRNSAVEGFITQSGRSEEVCVVVQKPKEQLHTMLLVVFCGQLVGKPCEELVFNRVDREVHGEWVGFGMVDSRKKNGHTKMNSANYHRVLPALLSPTNKPRSPHVLSDMCTILMERGHSVSLSSIDFEALSFFIFVDGSSLWVRAGPTEDNSATEVWYFVSNASNTNGFVRVNVAKILEKAPFRFEDLNGNSHFPIEHMATTWFDVWPKETMTWEDYSLNVLQMPSRVVEERDHLYVDECSLVYAIEFILPDMVKA